VILRAKRVGFWRRAIATLIDAVIAVVLCFVTSISMDFAGNELQWSAPTIHVMENYAAIITLIFYCGTEAILGGTPGKFFLGLEIANGDASAPSRWTLINRWTYKWTFLLITLLSMLFNQPVLAALANTWMFLILVGCLAALGDAKMTWHDRWAKTAVFHRRDLHPEKSPAGFPVVMTQPVKEPSL
jgi:uncharacterized RDD family membrane protein YckC